MQHPLVVTCVSAFCCPVEGVGRVDAEQQNVFVNLFVCL